MNLEENIELNMSHLEIDKALFYKMSFLYNALNSGWSVKKRNDSYIFTKTHEGKKEIFAENYLSMFMRENTDINKILS